MQLNFRPTAKILTLMLCLLALASCKGQQVQTFSPQEQAAARTKLAFQQQTQQVSQLKTQGLWTDGPQAQAELPPTSLPPAQTESTQMPGIPTATSALQSEQTQVVSTNTRQPTSPVLVPPTATRTRTQVSLAATPTRTKTPLPATPTITQTLQTGWEGEWNISFEIAEGNYVSANMSVSLDGTALTAHANLGGVVYLFEGNIFNNDQFATGSWQTALAEGSFWWMQPAGQQFSGSWDNRFGFCGKRVGANFPEPCKMLPSR